MGRLAAIAYSRLWHRRGVPNLPRPCLLIEKERTQARAQVSGQSDSAGG
jgi:hypothetical protein